MNLPTEMPTGAAAPTASGTSPAERYPSSDAASHHLRRVLAVVLGLTLMFLVGQFALTGHQTALRWWSNGWWSSAALVAGLRCALVAWRLGIRVRLAWGLFAAGCFSWFLGMVYWSYAELVLQRTTPFPAPSDIGFLLFAPLLSIGLIVQANTHGSTQRTLFDIGQLGVLVCTVVLVHVVLFYEPVTTMAHSAQYLLTALAYPAVYMALLIQAVERIWTVDPGPWRQATTVLVGAIAIHAVTDTLYAYSLLGHTYDVGSWLDPAWVMGFGFIYAAASIYEKSYRKSEMDVRLELTRALRAGSSMLIATLAILAGAMVILRQRLTTEVVAYLLPVIVVMLMFLVLREWGGSEMRRRLLRTAQEAESELKRLAQISPVGIFRAGEDGNWVYANQRACEIAGLPESRLVNAGWLEALHPDDRSAVLTQWSQALQKLQPFHCEFRFRRPNGTATWVLGQSSVHKSVDGEVVGFVGTITDISESRAAQQRLTESEERFRQFFASSPVIMGIIRLRDGRFVMVNDAFTQVFGWFGEETVGRTPAELGLWAEPEQQSDFFKRLRRDKRLRGVDIKVRAKSGELRDVLASIDIVSVDQVPCMFVVVTDITERIQAEAERVKLSSAMQQTADAVLVTDASGHIEHANPAFESMTGYSFEALRGKTPAILKSGRQSQEFYDRMWSTLKSGRVFSGVFINQRSNGTVFYEEQTITPLKDSDGRVTHFVSTGRDITQRMETEQRLRYLAQHDLLTDLPNRSLFLDRLEQSINRARWHDRSIAVLFMDIDRFKNINDTLGHEAGDGLLKHLSKRLRASLRERDTVARFGGDEFVIMLDDLAHDDDVGKLTEKILASLEAPFSLAQNTLHVTASVGISLYPLDGEDPGTLLKNADVAMYRAKDLGHNSYEFYSAEMTARAFERLTMENQLRRAVERREFVLYYQPQVDTGTGTVVGVEALLRWSHPERGLVSPAAFVPLLEETGLIGPVGEWLLDAACQQLAIWRERRGTGLRMSVNISSRQFGDPAFAEIVEQQLARHQLPGDALELELTESTLLHHGAQTERLLNALFDLGVRLAIDDFGTGYSSLGYLRRFSIDTLKIDRSFVLDIPGDNDDVAIARAIVGLGNSLQLDLIAEGVETMEQRDFLRSIGCHVMQGYLFSRPMPAESLSGLVADGLNPAAQPSQ